MGTQVTNIFNRIQQNAVKNCKPQDGERIGEITYRRITGLEDERYTLTPSLSKDHLRQYLNENRDIGPIQNKILSNMLQRGNWNTFTSEGNLSGYQREEHENPLTGEIVTIHKPVAGTTAGSTKQTSQYISSQDFLSFYEKNYCSVIKQ
jgi:hypothetical protein